MRTTIELPAELLITAKKTALNRNITLRELVQLALEKELAEKMSPRDSRVNGALLHVSETCPLLHLDLGRLKEIDAESDAEHWRGLSD